MTQARKRGRSGQRGIKQVDKVQDTVLFVAEFKDENGNHVRLGKIRLAHEINDSLKKIAYDLKTTKSGLCRGLFIDFIKDYNEAKATGAIKQFTPEATIEGWLQRRYDFTQLANKFSQEYNTILKNSQSDEVKSLANLVAYLGQMINITNKNVI